MEQEFRDIIALNIRVERVKRKLTQEQLAEMIDMSTKHLVKIENGRVTPSSYKLFRIAKVMNVSLDKLTTKEIL